MCIVVSDIVMFFGVLFFKQKTAYEMRISDWSSDVCSSDLLGSKVDRKAEGCLTCHQSEKPARELPSNERARVFVTSEGERMLASMEVIRNEIGRASCRERVCQYV